MTKKIRTEEVDHLFEAILTLENKDECYIIKVDKKTYLKYNIGEEYYRCEDD